MKIAFSIILILLVFSSLGQSKTPKDFGFSLIKFVYKNETVNILIKSKKGEENTKKPLFFFCQGSLPQPLIKFDKDGAYSIFPFNADSLTNKYHLVIVGKPYIPLMADVKFLANNFTFTDSIGNFPKKYSERNLPDYYVGRNIQIIKYLQKQNWVSRNQLVLAGHSEGSSIAAIMASKFSKVTHLIYSGGNPLGRIMSIIQQSRANETDTDSTKFGEDDINYWKSVVNDKENMDASKGDTNKATFDFSEPSIYQLEKLKIPVLVCYGTKDWSVPFNDFLRVDMIRKGKKNFTFMPYIGAEHNYFPLDKDNKPNYEIFNWD